MVLRSFAQALDRQVYLFESQLPKFWRSPIGRFGRFNDDVLMADIVVVRLKDGTEEIIKNRDGPLGVVK